MGDITFPGFVMLLKLASKLFIEREVSFMDAMKAMVVFPIDIIFLAFSFGAAILYATPVQIIKPGNIKTMFCIVVACITVSILITAFCKKGDRALDQKKFMITLGWATITYFSSVLALVYSLGIGKILG
jgi:hypothetical protein